MKRRHLIIINMVFVGFMLFSGIIVYQFLTGNKPLQVFSLWQAPQANVTTNACSPVSPIKGLAQGGDGQLSKLSVYQDACHSFITNTMMTFVGMPTTPDSAQTMAQATIAKFKAFAKYNVRPLVMAEPTDASGANIDFAQIASGAYDTAFLAYFTAFKNAGLSDTQMGIWNPLPEANLPYWNNNQPQYFAPGVTHYLTIARQVFPQLQTSVLLNSATYSTTDFNWENGDYESLSQYVKGIPAGLIGYAGLQGFPWSAPQGGTATIFKMRFCCA